MLNNIRTDLIPLLIPEKPPFLCYILTPSERKKKLKIEHDKLCSCRAKLYIGCNPMPRGYWRTTVMAENNAMPCVDYESESFIKAVDWRKLGEEVWRKFQLLLTLCIWSDSHSMQITRRSQHHWRECVYYRRRYNCASTAHKTHTQHTT